MQPLHSETSIYKRKFKFLYTNVKIYFYIMQIFQQQYKANEIRMARAHSMLLLLYSGPSISNKYFNIFQFKSMSVSVLT